MRLPDWRCDPSDQQIAEIRRAYPVERLVDEVLTQKMTRRASPAARVQTLDEIGDRLQAFLRSQAGEPQSISGLRKLTGGTSKEQYAFELTHQQGSKTVTTRLVLRLQPGESIVETHRLREYQVLAALAAHVPVPRPYWVDATGAELGQPGLIYQFCDGVTQPPGTEKVTGPQPVRGEALDQLLAPQFINHLAEIGRARWQDADMSAFDVPRVGTTDAAIWGVDCGLRIWEEDRIEAVPLITAAARWLRENAPVLDHVSVVHGDYRSGNFLFDPHSGKITAILDWEMSRLGDRHEDLGYIMSPVFGRWDENGNFLIGGYYKKQEFLDRYQRRSGLPLDPVRLTYYEVFNFWRQSITCLASAPRCMIGGKSSQTILNGVTTIVAPLMLNSLFNALQAATR